MLWSPTTPTRSCLNPESLVRRRLAYLLLLRWITQRFWSLLQQTIAPPNLGTVSAGAANFGGSFTPIVLVTDGTSETTLGLNWGVASNINITPIADQQNNEGDTVTLGVSASDAIGTATLSYSLADQPSGLSINSSTGLITGSIAAGDANSGGFYTPTVTVQDGPSSVSLTFNWSINSRISIVPIADMQSNENTAVSFQVSASDTDSTAALTYSLAGQPTGLSINATSGLISGTIAWGAANQGGYFSEVTVQDGTASNSVGFNWSVNSPVVIVPVSDQQSNEGDTIALQVSASDQHTGQTPTYALQGQPPGLSIDASTGLISGTIAVGAANQGGFFFPTVIVSDGHSSNTASFNWSVSGVNINLLADQQSSEGATVSVQVEAAGAGTLALSYAAAGLPNGLSINPSSGLISGTIAAGAANAVGLFSPLITVSDGPSSNSEGFNWTVTSAVSITGIGQQDNREGDTVSLQVSASTSNSGTTLTYGLEGQPTGLSINSSTGLISGTIAWGAANAGTSFTPTVLVNDGISNNSLGLNWTVSSAVSINGIANQHTAEGATVSLQVSTRPPTAVQR